MRVLAIFLLPFSFLYGLITDLRNFLYDRGLLKSIRFEVFTINIGNLRVGGTGKTPHVEYLIRLLANQYKLATLSRGYGRQTKGFILANEHATAATIGDEPMQFHQKFGAQLPVTVGEDRALAIPQLLYQQPEVQIILLDDAFQHRSVQPHLNILLTEYQHLFTRDWPFPAGRLRERRHGANRADIVVVSKCPPDVNAETSRLVQQEIRRYTKPNVPIFFSGVRYGAPLPYRVSQEPMGTDVVLLSGIANATPFETFAREKYRVKTHLRFNDHHTYTARDVEKISKVILSPDGRSAGLLTTEKDYVKLSSPPLAALTDSLPLYYLPIDVYFLPVGDGSSPEFSFDAVVQQLIKQHFVKES